MPSIIKVDQIQSDAGSVGLTGNVRVSSGTLSLNSTTNNGEKLRVSLNGDKVSPATSGNMTTGYIFQVGDGSEALNFGHDVNGTWYNSAYSNNAGVARNHRWLVGGSEAMNIDTLGRVTKPLNPGFIAYVQNDTSLTYNTTHQISQYYNLTDVNRGSHYNTSNGRFTAPVAGLYQFNFKYYVYPIASTESFLYVNGSAHIRYQMIYNYSSNTNPGGGQGTALINLNANDYVELYMNFNTVGGTNASLWNGGPRSSSWSGYLVA